jgi:transcriptional regulator of PTS gene
MVTSQKLKQIHFWDISSEDVSSIKAKYKIEVYKTICQDSSHTRGTLFKHLNYRNTTVSTLVQELIDVGLICNGERKTNNQRGRPDFFLIPNFDKFTAISVHVEDRNLIFSLININGDVLKSIKRTITHTARNRDFIKSLKSSLEVLLNYVPKGSTLLGIELLVNGTIDSKNLTWVDIFRWPNVKNLCLKELSEELRYPFYLRRILDAELEYQLDRHKEFYEQSTLLFMWGFGIGGSYSYKGNILESTFGRFIDMGHTIIHPQSGKLCRCGQYGCVETEAAIFAILPELKKIYPNLHEDSDEILRIMKDPKFVKLKVIEHAIDTVGICMLNLFKTLFPRRIFLIGPFFSNAIIVRKVLMRIEQTVSHYHGEIEITILEDGFTRCRWGGLQPLLREKLKNVLLK